MTTAPVHGTQFKYRHLKVNVNQIETFQKKKLFFFPEIVDQMWLYSNTPSLQILQQPPEYFRFRHDSEGSSHGSIESTVKLNGYSGEAVIFCWLYQISNVNENEETLPHWHQLTKHRQHPVQYDPIQLDVSSLNHYVATFSDMRIIFTKISDIVNTLNRKLMDKHRLQTGQEPTHFAPALFQENDERNIRKTINQHIVVLRFEAYKRQNGQLISICDPVYSTPIKNLSKCFLV